MPESHPVTLITVRIALVCYAIVVALMLAGLRGEKWRQVSRTIWSIGCLAFVAHVIAAFHFSHHWSHSHAIQTTAEQTEELIGWAFGEGLYFSYLFLLIWIADVASWWMAAARYERRPVGIVWSLHLYMFFIAVNGAIVFESGVTRPTGVVVIAIFGLILIHRLRQRRSVTPGS